jgi:hypothetical protein
MMGRQTVDQRQLFYLFNLERRIPKRHLLRRMNPIVTRIHRRIIPPKPGIKKWPPVRGPSCQHHPALSGS